MLSLTTGELLSINKEFVVLRSQPATNSQAIVSLDMDSNINVISERNGWLRVRYNGTTEGWIPEWLLESEVLLTDQNLAAHLLVASPIYSDQSTDSEQLADVDAGTYLIVNFESNGWLQVVFENQYGYIPTSSVELIHQDDIPETVAEQETSPDTLPDEMTPEELEAADRLVIVRQENQAFLSAPDLYSDIIYTPSSNQRFELIDTINGSDETEFYLVEDESGIRGYIESRVSALGSDSLEHVGTTNPGSLAEATIMIDAGHGGEDSGAISLDNITYEKDVTLRTAELLQAKLEALGTTVVQTRSDDSFVDLEERTDLSNEANVDAFLSLHYDSSPVPDWHGTTTYYFHQDDFDLADSINQQLSQFELPNNNVMFGNYHVLRENNQPSLLLELGYMSNSIDIDYIRSQEYLESITDLIIIGLYNYYNQ
ncbi:N-acetylmuramoyl-L-alanine amidase [Aerococcaceae bacterium DSM 111021]|nr:N-acetylmuramoyl-L-alanine amidase [Aerococcaceae bacterium DSM 111021]